MNRRASSRTIAATVRAAVFLLAALPFLATEAAAQSWVLDYLYRYDHQPGPDHIMNALEVSGGRAIVCSNRGLTLIDLDNLPPGGSPVYLDRLTGLNARDICAGPAGIYYVNLHRWSPEMEAGFGVVRLVGNNLQLADTVTEPGVLYEKMCIDDGFLYVAAHADGLRIYSLADPLAPEPAASLTEGFVDAFAVCIAGNSAYVADGAGGLKVVDVSDPAAPEIVTGETLLTATGTAEDVAFWQGSVYVALGGAGLGIYPDGDPARRELLPLDGCAESLCFVGDFLAVGTLSGVIVLDVGGPVPVAVAGETSARRDSSAELRICSGVGSASGNRLLCGNWDYLDVYRLTEATAGNQADITPSRQRIRFGRGGGTEEVIIRNDGSLPLIITSVTSTDNAFDCDYSGGTLPAGETVTCQISYDGSGNQAAGVVLFHSNDPDEDPLPIQVFGRTGYLDPGEMATDFTLPVLFRDPESGEFQEESFTLSDQQGKVVWFQVFGTW